ncbi:MAG: hypothetical protein EBY32_09485 [Proteobacteria bacterium]|nr:hypothetical protein [Pseudomonadota bacterium]
MSKRGALSLMADIVAAVYNCRSSGLSPAFGCKNNLYSSNANEDIHAPAELWYPSSSWPNLNN